MRAAFSMHTAERCTVRQTRGRRAPEFSCRARRPGDCIAGSAMAGVRTESMQQWERAEIVRSSVEATLTADQALKVSADTFARYARPPRDTAYPLEYAYHELGDVAGMRVVDFGCGSGAN